MLPPSLPLCSCAYMYAWVSQNESSSPLSEGSSGTDAFTFELTKIAKNSKAIAALTDAVQFSVRYILSCTDCAMYLWRAKSDAQYGDFAARI